MGIFSSDTMFTAKEMRGVRPQDSIAFRKLLSNEKIAAILDQKVERIAVWKRMKEEASKTQDGRLTRDGMRRVLGSLRGGKEATIDVWKEAIPLAHTILPGRYTKRYLNEEPKKDIRSADRFSPNSSASPSSHGTVSGHPASNSPRFSPPVKSSPRSFPTRPAF